MKRKIMLYIIALLGISGFLFFGIPHDAQSAATITIVNIDGPGEGLNDNSPPDPDSTAGGNTGTTLGAQRLIAFQFAANIWGNIISSNVEIRVAAKFDPLNCSATSAALGSAGPTYLNRNFSGAPLSDTWYPAALSNSLASTDLFPEDNDISATFNSSVGTTCSFPKVWYYGLDGNIDSGKIDFISVVLHEFAHGLGFVTAMNLSTGSRPLDLNDTFLLNLENHSTGKLFSQMTNNERLAAITNTGNLHWVGQNVIQDSAYLTSGRHVPSGHVEMYAPSTISTGSSVNHFSTSLSPNELLEPSYTGANHHPRLAVSLMEDIGWVITGVGNQAELIGVFRPSSGGWALDLNGNAQWDGCITDGCHYFGMNGDRPLSGDWNGDGISKIGVFRPSEGRWYLDLNGNAQWNGCTTDACRYFGMNSDLPVVGDWNGNGTSKIGVFRPSEGRWYLDLNGNAQWEGCTTDACRYFGMNGDLPVVGDWNGNGISKIGVFRPNEGRWYLDLNGNGQWDGCVTDGCYYFGMNSDLPVVGDWNGNGISKIGVFRPSEGRWYLDVNGNAQWEGCTTDGCHYFGMNGDLPITGRW
jgi:hypothetical protein